MYERPIYLLFEMCLDQMENEASAAVYWKPIGYVKEEIEARVYVEIAPKRSRKDCWALGEEPVSSLRYEKIEYHHPTPCEPLRRAD